jgi:NitT/TauT family transport system permease protein
MDEKFTQRPEFINDSLSSVFGVTEVPLTLREKIYSFGFIRKTFILFILASIWEIYGRYLDNPLLFPTFTSTITAFGDAIVFGGLLEKVFYSIKILLIGYLAGLGIAAILTVAAITTQMGNDFLETLTSMFNPLPAIALLPLALIWFGLGNGSIIFVLIHAVLWPVALNTHSGFLSVSPTLRMVGKNYGLTNFGFVTKILIPAGYPSILAGLKIGWAFAWRTLIAAELVFGVSSGSGGLGWFIYENKNLLEIPNVFAGLFTVILIGLAVENIIFKSIEAKTIRKWGMQN